MACAIRGNNDIKGIKLPGEPGGKELEAKISMFAEHFLIVRPKASKLFYNHNSVRSMVSSFLCLPVILDI
jgi:hypothetical protein